MGSSQARPLKEAQLPNAAEELHVEDKENTSAAHAVVGLCPAASDPAEEVSPGAPDAAIDVCPAASNAGVEVSPGALDGATAEVSPGASDATIEPCRGVSNADIQVSPGASNAAIKVCPDASHDAVEPCSDDSDTIVEECPGASDGAAKVRQGALDAAVEGYPVASDVITEQCRGASDASVEPYPDASDAAEDAEVEEKDAGDPERANRRRWAKVRLYTHALCGMGPAGAAASLSLPMILHCVSSQLLKHWCLIVRFLDEQDRDRVWLCDFGNALRFKLASAGAWHPRKGERINYMARPVSMKALRRGKLMERKFYLGTIQISENELKAICSSMRHNGKKYHPLVRNCQDCSKDLSRRLGLSSSVANDHLVVFLCPPVALVTELIGSAYNALTKFVASKSEK